MTAVSRRIARVAALAILGVFATLEQPARALDLAKFEDGQTALRKMFCSAKDGETSIFYWEGDAFGRVEGERDKLLFKLQGMNIRQCAAFTDPQRGPGFRLVSREVMLYLDPKTGEVLKNWANPYTNETVEVLHVANDPVNQFFGATGRDGKPATFPGHLIGPDLVSISLEVPLFYPNPLADSYQKDIPTYQAVEMFNFFTPKKEIDDAKVTRALSTTVAWTRIAPWLPWMNMGTKPGLMYFNTVGRQTRTLDDLPKTLRASLDTMFPDYKAPPPITDPRPNETSWTVYKKWRDANAARK